MRILHINTTDYGGTALCCLRIHHSLIELGIESKVVVLEKTTDNLDIIRYGNKLKIRFYAFVSKIASTFLELFGLWVTDRSLLKKSLIGREGTYTFPISTIDLSKCKWVEWADIIHLHWVNQFLDYPSFFRKVDKPIIWTLHDETLFCGIAHYRKDIIKDCPLEKKYLELKNKVIGPLRNVNIVFLSDYMRDQFKDYPIVKNKRQYVINNAVNGTDFVIYDKKKMRCKYKIPQDNIVFVFLAYDIFDERKGLKVLIEALQNNPESDRMLVLAIGGNERGNSVPDFVREMGFVNSPDILSEIMSCGDCFAMPSYQEAFAQSPMEAMACGLPVLAFPCSGTKELIYEHNGVICSDFTLNAFENGIKMILSHQYNRNEIRETVISRFSPNIIAKKYINLYSDILSV